MLARYSDVLAPFSIAPGVHRLLLQLPSIRLLACKGRIVCDNGCVVRAAPLAGGLRAGEGRPLTTVTLDQEAFGAPSVYLTELHILDLITPFGVLEYRH